ncbi:GNAT family N-acetyltransferase [Streptomyces sp. NPDC059070]|uniref:GNAT family N-acetyltransferase n=1 Tax=unclassified Streptomyces TaxID=2593676 RepID=UPI0034E29FE3
MEPVTLSTERLLLRPVGPQDADAAYAACQDPEIQRWTTVPSPYLRAHAEAFTATYGPNGWRDDSDYTFAVRLRETSLTTGTAAEGALVAMVSVTRRGDGVAELGFWAAKEHRGRGLMTEASVAAARWAFAAVGVERLEWRAEVGNAASRAVAEKVGFTMEGTLRASLVHGGSRRDGWIGSLLPSDLNLPTARAYLPARG